MTSGLLPEMAQSTFQPLLERLDNDRHVQAFPADEVRTLLRACGFGAAVLAQCSEMLKEFLREGVESRKFSFLLKEFTDTIERVLNEVYPRMRAIAEGETLPVEERLASLRTLDAFTARAMALRDEWAKLQCWVDRPAPQVDLASILGGTKTAEPRRYENLDDILARLKSGQEL
jgi:hypothetical protein